MPGAFGEMSGSTPTRVYVWLSYVSYDLYGNYSTWYYEVALDGNGNQSWVNDPVFGWNMSGFAVHGGYAFGLPYAERGGKQLASGYFTKAHDANGYLAAGDLRADIWSSDGRFGSGWAAVSSGTPPRIPKRPPAPTIAGYGFDQVTANSARFRFSSTGDGGSPITSWAFQLATQPDFSDAVMYSSTGTTILTDLIPGTTYYARARGQNAVGVSDWSAVASMTTLAGIYVSDGANWVAQPIRVSDGSAWANLTPDISDGTTWKDPINV